MFRQITVIFLLLIFGCCLSYAQTRKSSKPQIALPTDTALYNRALSGDAIAQAWVGSLYYIGEGGVPEDNKTALKWFRKSRNSGSPFGEYWLGIAYSNGIGSTDKHAGSRMFKAAIPKIEELANDSLVDAQYLMGLINHYGTNSEDGEPNYEAALKWYTLAASKGHIGAVVDGKECCEEYWGYHKRGTLKFIQDACSYHNPAALYELSKYYFSGMGFQQSFVKEAELLAESAELGYRPAKIELAERYINGIGIPQDTPKAIELYENLGLYYNIAELYRDGIGIDRDYDLAIKYFTKAYSTNRDTVAYKQKTAMQRKGREYYSQLPQRGMSMAEEVASIPGLSTFRLSANWDDVNDYMKALYLKHWKDEKIAEWSEDVALKVANHYVDIGFTREQLTFSQGWDYSVRVINTPNSDIVALEYPHCTYYLQNDKIFAMIWSNGVQVGNIKLIQKYDGDIVITE